MRVNHSIGFGWRLIQRVDAHYNALAVTLSHVFTIRKPRHFLWSGLDQLTGVQDYGSAKYGHVDPRLRPKIPTRIERAPLKILGSSQISKSTKKPRRIRNSNG